MLFVLIVFRKEKRDAETEDSVRDGCRIVRWDDAVWVWTRGGPGRSEAGDYDDARSAELCGIGGARQGAGGEGSCKWRQRGDHAGELQRPLHDADGTDRE